MLERLKTWISGTVLSESNRRTLRTAFQIVLALPTYIPLLYWGLSWLTDYLGADNQVVVLTTAIVSGIVAMAKTITWAEAKGLLDWLPGWLQQTSIVPPKS